MILVFDLDDTLYDEITYVQSSFKSVANYLSKKYSLNSNIIYDELLSILKTNGRGSVFDILLKQIDQYSKNEVRMCISVYRKNEPNISLRDDAERCLKRFFNVPKYLVTDGNKIVQRKKIKALNLNRYFKKTICTHDYGLKYSKPSTSIFNKIAEWENISPSHIFYIGDNPYKDFINLKKEGFRTIRIIKGMYKDIELNSDHEAHISIESLDQLNIRFLSRIL